MDANFSTMTMPKTMPVQNLLRYMSFKGSKLTQMKIFYPGVFKVAEVAEVKQPRNSKRRKFSNENL